MARSAEDAPHPRTGGWRTGPETAGRARCLRQLPAVLALLPGRSDPRRRCETFVGIDYEFCKAVRSAPRSARRARSTWSRRRAMSARTEAALELLTGGEAVAHAMRQIDPDVVPVYPIRPRPRSSRPSRSSCPTAAPRATRRRRVGAFGDERRDRLSPRRRADDDRDELPGSRADGGVYIAASMRAPVVVALGNRALSGPINIHCDHSDSMLIRDSRSDPALRRERAGGLRRDAARDAAGRALGRPAAGVRLPRRLHDHPLGRACGAPRRRAGPRVRRLVRRAPSSPRHARADHADRSRCRTTTSSCAGARPPRFTPRLECSSSSATSSRGSPVDATSRWSGTGWTMPHARSC